MFCLQHTTSFNLKQIFQRGCFNFTKLGLRMIILTDILIGRDAGQLLYNIAKRIQDEMAWGRLRLRLSVKHGQSMPIEIKSYS